MNRMKSDKRKILSTAVIEILGLILLLFVLFFSESAVSINRQYENSSVKLQVAQTRLTKRSAEASENMAGRNIFCQSKADSVAYFYHKNPDLVGNIPEMARQWDLAAIYLVSSSGSLISPGTGNAPDFTSAPFRQLIQSGIPFSENGMTYYCSSEDGNYIITASADNEFTDFQKELSTIEYSLKSIRIGSTGYIIAVSASDNKIAYSPDPSMAGLDASSIGLTDSYLSGKQHGWINFGGCSYYCVCSSGEKYDLAAVIPRSEVMNINFRLLIILALIYVLIITLILLYLFFVQKDQHKLLLRDKFDIKFIHICGNRYFDASLGRRIRNITLLGMLLIFLASFYVFSLAMLSRQSVRQSTKLDDIESILDDNQARLTAITQEYDREYLTRAKSLAYMLEQDPSLVSDSELETLAKCENIKAIYVFDENGHVDASNTRFDDFTLSTDPSDQSYAFWKIIKGYSDDIIQNAQPDDSADHNYIQYIGTKRLDAPGMIQIGVSPERLQDRTDSVRTSTVLSYIGVENSGFTFASDASVSHNLIYYPDSSYIGYPASKLGLSDSVFKNNFSGFKTISGTKYFLSCRQHDDEYLFVAAPYNRIISGRGLLAGLATVISVVVIILMSISMILVKKEDIELQLKIASEGIQPDPDIPLREPRGIIEITTGDGKTRKVQSVTGRWDHRQLSEWSDLNADEKIRKMIGIVFMIAGVAAVVFLYAEKKKDPIISYILNRQWEKVPGIFSLTYILLVTAVIIIVASMVRKLIILISTNVGARSETIGRLANNFIKYTAVIFDIFYCLNFLGVNAATLLASAGIVTLVIGLGAQSLIGDIIAGIFIVFEGDFQVGDIVTVDTWRGVVKEIGIRSTKIEDASHNVKIFNNSQIRGVINMTKKYSYASCDIGIEYDESLEYVEGILEKELPKIRDNIPDIESGPFYKGVVSLSDSSVILRIVAQCQEGNRIQVCRSLNREMKLLFDRYNINIPFPQVVVSKPDHIKHRETSSEKAEVKKFVEDQQTVSRDININDDV